MGKISDETTTSGDHSHPIKVEKRKTSAANVHYGEAALFEQRTERAWSEVPSMADVTVERGAGTAGHCDDEPTFGGQIPGCVREQDLGIIQMFENFRADRVSRPALFPRAQFCGLQQILLGEPHIEPATPSRVPGPSDSLRAVFDAPYVHSRVQASENQTQLALTTTDVKDLGPRLEGAEHLEDHTSSVRVAGIICSGLAVDIPMLIPVIFLRGGARY
jgi:hypothetical protein